MTYYYFDTSGDRKWNTFNNAINILDNISITVNSDDVIFIHLTDFDSGLLGIDLTPGVSEFIAKIEKDKYIINPSATVLFITGGKFTRKEIEDTKEIIKLHNHNKITFIADRIDRNCDRIYLEEKLAPILEDLKTGTIRDLEEKNLVYQLQTVFMMLWQGYCLKKAIPDQVPESFKKAKKVADNLKINEDYWKPILTGNQINPLLIKFPPPNYQLDFSEIANITDWRERHKILPTLAAEYLDRWLGVHR